MSREFAKKFYNSSTWKNVRQAVLRRDSYMCQECRAAPAEEVHHIVWLTPNNITNANISLGADNLVSLCFNCHKQKHAKQSCMFDENGYPIPPVG